ncbi:hypothetical protein ERJ75_000179700 [Trypanosoma vivax]|nr:hypothetical protein TRVL_05998 [Trypanosoma vivax]KAH8619355.1 hypothetical protein ERJ75_000179700 [Trypanosoma vivax]
MAFLTKSKQFFAREGNALTNTAQTIADAEWNIFLCAMRAFVEKHGRGSFSFVYRPRADVGVAHADGFLRMGNGELLLFFEIKQVKFTDLRNATLSFELPKSGDFICAFEATKECFQSEWRALEENMPALFRQCEALRSRIREERQRGRAAFNAADGENNCLKQRICRPEGQIQQMLERTKSFQDANGALAAENGLLKAGRVHAAMETRCASSQRSEHNTQLPQQWAEMVFHAPTAGEQKQLHGAPLTTNVGFRGVQALRDKLGGTSFKPEEKIRTYEGAFEYLTATSPEHLFAARRAMFPMPSKLCFLLQDAWGEMMLCHGRLAKWLSQMA